MDPVTLVVGALAAGASAGLTEAASDTVVEAYARLKAAVGRLFRGKPDAELVLRRHEEDSKIWQAPLGQALEQAGVMSDERVLAAAQQLMALLDAQGAKAGKYVIEVHGSQGTVIGDHATVTQTFGSPPGQ